EERKTKNEKRTTSTVVGMTLTIMSLLKWCDEGPATVSLQATVEDAIRTMLEKQVGAVAVIDEQGVVAGMFTERDVLAKFALSGRDPKRTPVHELMSPMVEILGVRHF